MVYRVNDYFQVARENEEAFRNILRDLRNHRAERPMGMYIPKDLKTEIPFDEFFKEYSQEKNKIFAFTDFSMPKKAKARIAFHDEGFLYGGFAELEYLIKEDDTVQYQGPFCLMSRNPKFDLAGSSCFRD